MDHPIKRYRLKHGMSQPALAEHLGVTKAAVSRWEARLRAPRRKDLPRIAEKLGLTPAEVLGFEEKITS